MIKQLEKAEKEVDRLLNNWNFVEKVFHQLEMCDVYLEEALPAAREEYAALKAKGETQGQIDRILDSYVADCGTKGCVAFYFVQAYKPAVLRGVGKTMLDDAVGDYVSTLSFNTAPFNVEIAFGCQSVSLDKREKHVTTIRDILINDIQCIIDLASPVC